MDGRQQRDSDDRAQRSILLLPGLCTPAEVMRPLKLRLERRLRCPAHIVSLGAACGDIRDLAERTHVLLEKTLASQPGARVDVIGHSMGGIVAAYLLKCLDRGGRVRSAVTLGTPHRGLPIGRAGWLVPGPVGRTLRQLRPGSSLLDLLGRLTLPEHCELVSIAGLADAIVAPDATRLPGLPNQRNLEIAADHLGLVFSKLAADSLVSVLAPEALAPAAGTDARAGSVAALRPGALAGARALAHSTRARNSRRQGSMTRAKAG
jgi:pimeloyl-ACP methyl ester carboxylesterase